MFSTQYINHKKLVSLAFILLGSTAISPLAVADNASIQQRSISVGIQNNVFDRSTWEINPNTTVVVNGVATFKACCIVPHSVVEAGLGTDVECNDPNMQLKCKSDDVVATMYADVFEDNANPEKDDYQDLPNFAELSQFLTAKEPFLHSSIKVLDKNNTEVSAEQLNKFFPLSLNPECDLTPLKEQSTLLHLVAPRRQYNQLNTKAVAITINSAALAGEADHVDLYASIGSAGAGEAGKEAFSIAIQGGRGVRLHGNNTRYTNGHVSIGSSADVSCETPEAMPQSDIALADGTSSAETRLSTSGALISKIITCGNHSKLTLRKNNETPTTIKSGARLIF